MSDKSDKQQVRELLDRLPEDATFADIQRALAVMVWPKARDGSLKAPERLEPEEVKRRLREWLKSEKDK
jgi:DNA mismatch repair ATPase MutL